MTVLEHGTGPAGDVVEQILQLLAVPDPAHLGQAASETFRRRPATTAGVGENGDPAHEIWSPVSEIEDHVVVAQPRWAEVGLDCLVEAAGASHANALRRDDGAAVVDQDMDRAVVVGSTPAGASCARRADSPSSAAGQQASTAALARWLQLSGPVWLT